jgi:hypothetical protein
VRPDHIASVARRKANRPDAVVMSWECLPFDGPTECVRVTLADDPVNWANPGCVDITPAEEQAEKARFESEERKCHLCGGDGKEWRGWSHGTGHRYRTCVRCSGTGTPPVNAAKERP